MIVIYGIAAKIIVERANIRTFKLFNILGLIGQPDIAAILGLEAAHAFARLPAAAAGRQQRLVGGFMARARGQVDRRRFRKPHARGKLGRRQRARANCCRHLGVGRAQPGNIAAHGATQRLVQKPLAERLGSAGAQRHPAHDQLAVVGQQRA